MVIMNVAEFKVNPKEDAKIVIARAKEIAAKGTLKQRREMKKLLANIEQFDQNDPIGSGNLMLDFFRQMLKMTKLDDLPMRRLLNNNINFVEALILILETTKKKIDLDEEKRQLSIISQQLIS